MLLALLRKVPEVRRTTCSLEGALEQLKESAMPDADLNTRTLALTLTLTVTLTQESAMPDADLNGKASATSRAEEAAAGRSGDQKEKEAEAPRDGDEARGSDFSFRARYPSLGFARPQLRFAIDSAHVIDMEPPFGAGNKVNPGLSIPARRQERRAEQLVCAFVFHGSFNLRECLVMIPYWRLPDILVQLPVG